MKLDLPAGGILVGLGTDIVEVERIRNSHTKFGDRFLRRVFTTSEQAYCLGMRNPFPHLAARFAAKEAVSKAFTTGIGKELGWKSVSVAKGSRQEPLVELDEQGAALLHAVNGTALLVSLSHTASHAMAVAAIVREVSDD